MYSIVLLKYFNFNLNNNYIKIFCISLFFNYIYIYIVFKSLLKALKLYIKKSSSINSSF